MFFSMGDDWKGSYIEDIESQTRKYFRSPGQRRTAKFKQRGLEAIVNFNRYGLPAIAAWGTKRLMHGKRSFGDMMSGKPKTVTFKNPLSMPYKRKRSVSKRRSYSKKRVLKKRRKGRRGKRYRKKVKGSMARRILSAITPMRVLTQTFNADVEDSSGNDQRVYVFEVSHTKWAYHQLLAHAP